MTQHLRGDDQIALLAAGLLATAAALAAPHDVALASPLADHIYAHIQAAPMDYEDPLALGLLWLGVVAVGYWIALAALRLTTEVRA